MNKDLEEDCYNFGDRVGEVEWWNYLVESGRRAVIHSTVSCSAWSLTSGTSKYRLWEAEGNTCKHNNNNTITTPQRRNTEHYNTKVQYTREHYNTIKKKQRISHHSKETEIKVNI